MSHFSHLEMKLNNIAQVKRLCNARGWSVEENDFYEDAYKNSMEGGYIIKDAKGKVKALIQKDGSVTVDPYYMGRDYQGLLQDYALEHIKQKAMMEGAMTVNQGRDKQGNLILEVTY